MARKLHKYDDVEKMKEDDFKKLAGALLMEDGKEYPSAVKMFVDVENPPNTLKEQVERIIGSYLFQQSMKKEGMETIEDFEDFNIADEPEDPISKYEIQDMEEEFLPQEETPPPEEKNDMKAEPEPEEKPEA